MFVLCGKKIRCISNLGAVERLVYVRLWRISNRKLKNIGVHKLAGAFKSGRRAAALHTILLVF
jgi:hypothetical protein